ncbi:MAG: type II toxin-antitoxin system VapC family toxin [Sphingomonadaceae bacterium]|nr:type II toxin-antitoxin system VapC family toxin [Sphingomonadaceae bacterium]
MLIDTNVWSELTRPRPDPGVIAFLSENEHRLYLSTIVLSEIEYGIAKAPEPVRAQRLLESRNDVVLRISDRILYPDFLTATVWGKLKAELTGVGTPIPDFDLLICAQAIAADMPVVTRNGGHMQRTGATIINPWET